METYKYNVYFRYNRRIHTFKKNDGTISVSGCWTNTSSGITTCPFTSGTAAVSGNYLTFSGSGTAVNVQSGNTSQSAFTVSVSNAIATNGYISVYSTIAFSASGWGTNYGIIEAVRISGSNITTNIASVTVIVSTIAGSGSIGSADGISNLASFNNPESVAVDSSGNVYVADSGNNKIRKITPAGMVSTFAGSGVQSSTDGNGSVASFYDPEGLAFDSSGNIYVVEGNGNKIRKIIQQ